MSEIRAPSAWTVETVMSIAQAALSRLEASDVEIATDEDELMATLRNEGADVETILRRLILASQEAKSMAAAAESRVNDLRARKDRYAKRAESWRGAAFAVMDALGMQKHTTAEYTASIAAPRVGLIITDEAALPEEYVVVTRAPDKAKIKDDMKNGVVIPGVEEASGIGVLTIRSK